MSAAPITFAAERVMLDPSGVAFFPARRLLVVADLHLEKGSSLAARGSALPPYDSRATLERLWRAVRLWRPARLVALGDSFHDREGHARLEADARTRLGAIARETELVWVLGNHDPTPPTTLPGTAHAEWREQAIALRHQGGGGTPEICGHHHPQARIATRGGGIQRPCFVVSPSRLMLPAFGAYTGGLDVRDPAIAGLFRRGARLFLLGRERLFRFTLAEARASAEA
ncbi:MAG: ligase-associated DNA damage response endonuclease PdeM [Acetobacteraceae bacterium]|nr:ligase-associated DNA damage response endonuclease PdeM [Acetobacteraceae bacterium]